MPLNDQIVYAGSNDSVDSVIYQNLGFGARGNTRIEQMLMSDSNLCLSAILVPATPLSITDAIASITTVSVNQNFINLWD